MFPPKIDLSVFLDFESLILTINSLFRNREVYLPLSEKALTKALILGITRMQDYQAGIVVFGVQS